MARQVRFLKAENDILRARLPRRITVTAQERKRLVKFGRPLGAAIKGLISIVSPRTFLRWLQGENVPTAKAEAAASKPGRPKASEDVCALVLLLARKTPGVTLASSVN